jgi:hypothetical protein
MVSLLAALTGCGRGTTDLYRAYNLTTIVDKSGKPTRDLASQNRVSLQTSGEYSYFYVAPEHEDFANPDPYAKTTEADEADEDSDEAVDEASDESADESTDESEDSGDELEEKIDELSDAVEALGEDE